MIKRLQSIIQPIEKIIKYRILDIKYDLLKYITIKDIKNRLWFQVISVYLLKKTKTEIDF